MPKIKTLPLLESIFKTKGGTSDLWKAINNLINKRENEIPVFCNYIKHKINGYDKQNSLLALDFIDFCVDNGNISLWSQLNSKDFLSSLITNLKTREDLEIQSKILFLIEKWAKKFYNYPELSNFQNVYGLLRKNNVQFPTDIESNYHNYVKREITYTSETLVIRKGILNVKLYENQIEKYDFNLKTGDIITLLSGGHGFTVVDDVDMVEIKQGPFVGPEDKTRF